MRAGRRRKSVESSLESIFGGELGIERGEMGSEVKQEI